MQTELNLIYALRSNFPPEAEPKAEPHRIELDLACERVFALVRAAVQSPSQRNLYNVTSAIRAAHKSLNVLNAVEADLACHG